MQDRVVDLLDLSGGVVQIALSEIKHICYVRDFNLNDPVTPERLTRRTFLRGPRTEGLWLRLTFRGQASPSSDPNSSRASLLSTSLCSMTFSTTPDSS